jgi:hypothetical protein
MEGFLILVRVAGPHHPEGYDGGLDDTPMARSNACELTKV